MKRRNRKPAAREAPLVRGGQGRGASDVLSSAVVFFIAGVLWIAAVVGMVAWRPG